MKRKDNKGRVLKDGEYQRADGRYEYRYIERFSGKPRSAYSWRLNETDGVPEGKKRDKSLRELEREIRDCDALGIDSYAADRITLNELYEKRMRLSTHLLETTRANQNAFYNRHVRDTLGRREVGSIRYSDVMALYVSLMDESGLAVSSVERLNTIIHGALTLAVRDGLILRNPADGVMKELKKRASRKPETERILVLSREQEAAFRTFLMCANRFRRWRLIFTVLFETGIRVGELCGLTWADVDFQRRVLCINRSLAYGKGGGERCRFTIHPTKTKAGQREIPMTSELFDALKKEYAARSLTGFCPTEVDGVTGFVFWKPSGSLYQKGEIDLAIDNIRNAYNKIETERAGEESRLPLLIPHFSAHSIRHTFLSRLVEVGANIKAIQNIAGHASVKMTVDIRNPNTIQSRKQPTVSVVLTNRVQLTGHQNGKTIPSSCLYISMRGSCR